MSRRTSPPFRADHVGSLLRPPRLHQAREDFAAGRIEAACARSRTRRSPARCGCRRRSACSRPPTGSSAGPPGTWTSSTRSAGYPRRRAARAVKFTNPSGTIEWTPAALHVDSKVRMDQTIFGADFHYEVAGEYRGAEADDPVAEHGALPRWPGDARSGGLPRHRGVLGRPGRGLRRRGAAAEQAGLRPAVRRHVAGLPERPGPACRRSPDAARTLSTCTCATSGNQRRGRRAARGYGCHDPPVPRQLPRSSGWCRGDDFVAEALLQAGGGRLPGSTTTSGRRGSSRCGSCLGEDGGGRPGHDQVPELESEG